MFLFTVPVAAEDTLSGLAASHGVSLSSLEAANPQFGDPNLIYAGQTVTLPGSGSSTPAPSQTTTYTPSTTTYHATPVAAGSLGDGSGLDDVPGVPSGFAACVAYRESTDGTDAAYNGGVYGIITASGVDVNGQSVSAQKAAFSRLYAEYGSAPWAPSDGC
jgi:hypothetical protein